MSNNLTEEELKLNEELELDEEESDENDESEIDSDDDTGWVKPDAKFVAGKDAFTNDDSDSDDEMIEV